MMEVIKPVPFYPEKKSRFKSKIRRCGVVKDKPTIVWLSGELPLESYPI